MARDWNELTKLTGGAPLVVEKVRLADSGIAIEGAFNLPLLAQLPSEDQVFISAFVVSHGSIKDMERLFGISYPTVKARLDRLAEKLNIVEINPPAVPDRGEAVLEGLEKGEIDVKEALRRLGK
jgi:hypothetical protein